MRFPANGLWGDRNATIFNQRSNEMRVFLNDKPCHTSDLLVLQGKRILTEQEGELGRSVEQTSERKAIRFKQPQFIAVKLLLCPQSDQYLCKDAE